MQIDFEKFEEKLIERFKSTIKNSEDGIGKLTITIGKIAARIATMAIQEYHLTLNEFSAQDKR